MQRAVVTTVHVAQMRFTKDTDAEQTILETQTVALQTQVIARQAAEHGHQSQHS